MNGYILTSLDEEPSESCPTTDNSFAALHTGETNGCYVHWPDIYWIPNSNLFFFRFLLFYCRECRRISGATTALMSSNCSLHGSAKRKHCVVCLTKFGL